MLRSLGILFASLLLLTACQTVDTSSSESGNATIAAQSKCYVSSDFPETDGQRHPELSFQDKVKKAVKSALESKGYTIVDDPSEAGVIINGSWLVGKVMDDTPAYRYYSNRAGSAYYLTLTAVHGGESLWSAQAPIGKEDGLVPTIDALLAGFPEKS